MGKEVYDNFPVARQVFLEVDEALQQKLSQIIFNGSQEELTLTENTQPALMVTSIAILTVLLHELGCNLTDICSFISGHSLGEYTALTAAGAIPLAATAKLLRIRGNAMQSSVEHSKGGMVTLLGAEFDAVKRMTEEASLGDDLCQIANDNSPGQVVLSGTLTALARVTLLSNAAGHKIIPLSVSAPFHSKLMAPAREIMQKALQDIMILPPSVPLITNVTADFVTDPATIKKLLVKQMTSMVRWRETILRLQDLGAEEVVEIGAGKVLTGLTKRNSKELVAVSMQNVEDIKNFIKLHHDQYLGSKMALQQ
jgi:[acyl-carrier-protein] S-malonyltransferase